MRVSILLIVSVVFYVLAADTGAYTKPKDVYGWGNLKWGMSVSKVEAVMGKGIKKRGPKYDTKDGVYTELEMRDIKIGGKDFRASFWMDTDTKELSKIVFVPQTETDSYNWAETFIKLEESLVDKYGEPDIEKTSNDPGTSAERVWNFPSTVIEMSYLRIEDTELLMLIFSET